MQRQESWKLKHEKEAKQCVDFTDESPHKSDSNDNNMDGGDDDFCAVNEGYYTQNTVRNVTGYITSAVFWLHKDCSYGNFYCDKC